MELVSPAAEDHILDCALLHRKMSHEGQLVLLSNDITLKIKAMAEVINITTTMTLCHIVKVLNMSFCLVSGFDL